MLFSALKVFDDEFRNSARKATAQQDHQKRSIAHTFQSLGARSRQSPRASSIVNQLTNRTPNFFASLTRRMPATNTALKSPESLASYAESAHRGESHANVLA
jgi:hypothetical protein